MGTGQAYKGEMDTMSIISGPNKVDHILLDRQTVDLDMGTLGQIRLDLFAIVEPFNRPHYHARVCIIGRETELPHDTSWQEIRLVD